MSNYSVTNADMSRESREELYDGTARITRTDPQGNVTEELVPSDEQAPIIPEPIEDIVADLPAYNLEEANDLMVRIVTTLSERGII